MSRAILITGAKGYIASSLLRNLEKACCEIRCASRTFWHPDRSLQGFNLKFITGDIKKTNFWNEHLSEVNTVFHLAAQTSVPVSDQDYLADWKANVEPILHLVETSRKLKVYPAVVFAGSATQVGITTQIPVNEDQPDNPMSVYDLHKLMGENYLEYSARLGIVRATTLRLANVYGPGPPSTSADRGVLNSMISRAIRGEPLTVYGSGLFYRDYVYVDDVAKAFVLAAEQMDHVNGRHFVIGSGQCYTITAAVNLVADRVALRTGCRPAVVHVDPPPNQLAIDGRQFVADSSAFSKSSGWRSIVSLAEGIDRTIDFYLKNAIFQ